MDHAAALLTGVTHCHNRGQVVPRYLAAGGESELAAYPRAGCSRGRSCLGVPSRGIRVMVVMCWVIRTVAGGLRIRMSPAAVGWRFSRCCTGCPVVGEDRLLRLYEALVHAVPQSVWPAGRNESPCSQ
ncbi:hypothetical protein TPA0906_12250 [Streptomyces olivaceus]|nr:hypothetical protein TPA0906_12250 [Streptomyces olivaceus]